MKLAPGVHKIKNKDQKKLANRKKKEKKYLNALDSNPHLLSAKTLNYPLGYRGIVIHFFQISNCTTIYEDSRRLSKRSLNIYMSRVNFDKQYCILEK